jgi:sulfur-carrier protein
MIVGAASLGPTPPAPASDRAPTDVALVLEVAPAPARLTVRYFAGARAAAGGVSAEQAEAGSLDELTQLLTDRHGERLAVVLKAASFLVDGLACHNRRAPLPADATVDVLPPFAGG